MKRPHRRAHQAIWILLAILITTGFTLALVKRKPPKKKAQVSVIMLADTHPLQASGARS